MMSWDVIVIGGGATGLGIALDCTTRGLKTLLVEKNDFSSGTSSKSTKLIHGGVRYLKQLNFKLVYEAIQERKLFLENQIVNMLKLFLKKTLKRKLKLSKKQSRKKQILIQVVI